MQSEQVTVSAPIRRRTGADEPVATEEHWDQQTAASHGEAREAISARLADDEIVLAWYADRVQA